MVNSKTYDVTLTYNSADNTRSLDVEGRDDSTVQTINLNDNSQIVLDGATYDIFLNQAPGPDAWDAIVEFQFNDSSANRLSSTFFVVDRGEEISDYTVNYRLVAWDEVKSTSVSF